VARVLLQWKSGNFALEPVPSSLFSHSVSTSAGREDVTVERGRTLVEELGCVNCHASGSTSLQKRFGPHLTGLGQRVNPQWLYRWLDDASTYRAGAVMPAMLDARERRDVTSYLSGLKGNNPPGQAQKPSPQDITHGRQLYGTIGCAACHQQTGLSLEGIGSKMTIAPLVDYLKDPSRFDPSGRMPSMMLSEAEASHLASFLTESRKPAFERPWQAGDPVSGKRLIVSKGCLACHVLNDPTPLANGQTAPRLEKLAPERGCLAGDPKGVPRYRLSADQRLAIQAFLRNYQHQPDRSPAPVYSFRRTLELLRCVACHQIDSQAPTGSPAEAAPPLTDTGGKLRTGWIAEVLTNRKRALSGIELRMPHYNAGAVMPLIEGFAKSSGVEPGNGMAAPPASDAVRTRGVEKLGFNVKSGGMACLGCHDWGEFKSQGEQGPQLMSVAERLRYDWFQRWMLDPVRILSGTSMPNYFRSMKRDEADAVIHSLWAAMAMREAMPLPEGVKRAGGALGSEERPVPTREAIVIRWDMPEATPAAIAVGMPGGISYCFDAGESRLRYAWLGGFLDMSGTLHRKVDENKLTPTAKLIGEIFYRSDDFPIRIGALDRIPERQFRGYRLIDGYPQFHYQVDGVDVYERMIPAKSQKGLTREFTIGRVDRSMWLLAGQNAGVAVSSTIGQFQDGRLSLPRGNNVRVDVTIVKQ
jgi:mono/diheme cytochrome c family protein